MMARLCLMAERFIRNKYGLIKRIKILRHLYSDGTFFVIRKYKETTKSKLINAINEKKLGNI
jgi:hypothetical protein